MTMHDPHSATPPGADEGSDVPEMTGPTGRVLAERLAALDELYEKRHITAAELGEARRELLASAGPATPPSAEGRATGQDGAGAPMPDRIDPSNAATERRIAGLPMWAVAVAGGVAALLLIALVAVLVRGGGGSEQAPESATGARHAAQIKRPLTLLNASAVATSKALARVAEPGELAAFNRAAERQLDVVEEARAGLTSVDVSPADRRAQSRLIAAAAAQRRYLVQLGRASAGTPSAASLSALNRARRAGGQTISAYETFFALVPAAPDAITSTDLTDTAGLRSAIAKGIAAAEKPAAPVTRVVPVPVPAPAPVPASDAGVNYDIVANSGGEGVRYRYSAQLSDLVPGNGPLEGNQVSVNCFVTGEFVRSTDWWAYLTNGYYVPATYLRYSGSGPVVGARYC